MRVKEKLLVLRLPSQNTSGSHLRVNVALKMVFCSSSHSLPQKKRTEKKEHKMKWSPLWFLFKTPRKRPSKKQYESMALFGVTGAAYLCGIMHYAALDGLNKTSSKHRNVHVQVPTGSGFGCDSPNSPLSGQPSRLMKRNGAFKMNREQGPPFWMGLKLALLQKKKSSTVPSPSSQRIQASRNGSLSDLRCVVGGPEAGNLFRKLPHLELLLLRAIGCADVRAAIW